MGAGRVSIRFTSATGEEDMLFQFSILEPFRLLYGPERGLSLVL